MEERCPRCLQYLCQACRRHIRIGEEVVIEGKRYCRVCFRPLVKLESNTDKLQVERNRRWRT